MNKSINPFRTVVKTLLLLSTLGILFYIIWFLGLNFSIPNENSVSSWGLILLALLSAILGGYIASSPNYPKAIRRTWGWIGLANLSNCIAEFLWLYFSVQGIEPFPSLADVFYLLFYPLLLAGILSLPYLPTKREHRLMIGLDISIVMVVGGMLLWVFLLGPIIDQHVAGLTGLISLAYPVGDFLILAGLISLIQRDLDSFGRTNMVLIIISMFSTGLADLLFAIVENNGFSFPDAFMNAMWMLSGWAILTAAGWQILSPGINADTRKDTFIPLLRRYNIYFTPFFGLLLAFGGLARVLVLNNQLIGTIILTSLLLALIYIRQGIVLHDNQKLYKYMEQLAITDALTTINNRHSFNETISKEIIRANRQSNDLSLLLIDVDNFKNFNDTCGHLAGDQLLKDIALSLKNCIRRTDYLARYGGDEFVIILPDTNLNKAALVSEKIQQTVSAEFSNKGVGVSIGMADFLPGMTDQAFLNEADKNLYIEKNKKLKT